MFRFGYKLFVAVKRSRPEALRLFHRSISTRLLGAQLKSRSLVRVSGPEAIPFLQGLVTNDLIHLETQPAIYTLFLSANGRVLLDSLIYKEKGSEVEPSLLLESDATLRPILVKHLKLYRVRRKVIIDEAELNPWVIFNPAHRDADLPRTHSSKRPELILNSHVNGIGDPRLEELGWRVLLGQREELKPSSLEGLEIVEESQYKSHLYALGVGEGRLDLPNGNSFPLESNGDYLHGISFQKGCYIGQELTARTHHTGVVRKRLMPFRLPENFKLGPEVEPSSLQLLNPAGKSVGKVRNIINSYGLALTRIEEALSAKEVKLDKICSVTLNKPGWWPTEAPKEPIIHSTGTTGSQQK